MCQLMLNSFQIGSLQTFKKAVQSIMRLTKEGVLEGCGSFDRRMCCIIGYYRFHTDLISLIAMSARCRNVLTHGGVSCFIWIQNPPNLVFYSDSNKQNWKLKRKLAWIPKSVTLDQSFLIPHRES